MKIKENQAYKYLKSTRGSWGDISPVTRIKESRKVYNRKRIILINILKNI